jgi:hypothetical protein
MNPATAHDVVILGGGLAGLCLALQLPTFSDLDIVVLGMPRLRTRWAITGKSRELFREIQACVSISMARIQVRLPFLLERVAGTLKTSGWRQRGPAHASSNWMRHLREHLASATARQASPCMPAIARGVDFGTGDAHHEVRASMEGGDRVFAARWVVDASSVLHHQAGWVWRPITTNAVWFSHRPVFPWTNGSRCAMAAARHQNAGARQSPVWRGAAGVADSSSGIRLASSDPAIHPLDRMNTFERALDYA